jgi:tyrosyl-tRNA synthetase
MMAKDSVKNRITGADKEGMSFTEFTYQLIQGYDFLHLWKNEGVMLQMGGSDQWGNITTGTELIRRMEGGEAFALTTPLIKKADGTKFGKTEGGNIWLDPKRTSPYKFYQFWLNAADADAPGYLKIFSLKSREEIEGIIAEHEVDPGRRILQKALAEELTARVHDQEALEQSIAASQILFGNSDTAALQALNDDQIQEIFEGVAQGKIAKSEVESGISLLQLLVKCGFMASNGEARRALQENSISVNKSKVNAEAQISLTDCLNQRYILLQRGKKNYFLLEVEG